MRLNSLALLAWMAVAASVHAGGPSHYVLTDLGHLPGGSFAAPIDLNDDGQIIGTANVPDPDNPANQTYHGFLWDSGTLIDLGTAGYTFSNPSGINNAGQIVGRLEDGPTPEAHAFLYDGSGMHLIGPELGFAQSKAYGINGSGMIVGSWSSEPDNERPFRYDGANVEFVATLTEKTEARQVNDLGQAVGYTMIQGNRWAFRWDDDDFVILNVPAGGTGGGAVDINNHGQAIGHWRSAEERVIERYGTTETIYRAALYESDGTAVDLGTLGGDVSAATGINDVGQIVGISEFGEQDLANHAFVYHTDYGMIDLNDLIHPSLGWELTYASGINDRGQIVGYATNRNGFLLTPANPGDADLDGVVDLSDLTALANRFGANSGAEWWSGDFDADGDVDLADLTLLAGYYASGEAQAYADFETIAVPEPTVLIWTIVVPLLARRTQNFSGRLYCSASPVTKGS
jgi:probable HAF family extracellular repeat protein